MAATNLASILEDYNSLTAKIDWISLLSLLDGFDDAQETYTFSLQPRLIEFLRSLSGRQFREAYLIPLRNFVVRYWFHSTRTQEENEILWYERRFSFIKLCTIVTAMERVNYNNFPANRDSVPQASTLPRALAQLTHEMVTFGVKGWPALREKMRVQHLQTVEACKPFVDLFLSPNV